MTETELRQHVANLHGRYDQLLDQLGIIVRQGSDAATATGELTTAVWATRAEVSGMRQQLDDHGRRLCEVECWCKDKDEMVTATGRHDITELRRQLREREAARVARRQHWVRYGVATAIGLATSAGLLWLGLALGGCI